jgi:hypothetical protein
MSKELDRLTLHRQIVEGKLAIPSNEATRASLSQHLARIDAQIEQLTRPREKRDPLAREHTFRALERELALRAQYKRWSKYWTPQERRNHRERIREARLYADEGIRLPKWKPLSMEELAILKERLAVVLAKYARVPA